MSPTEKARQMFAAIDLARDRELERAERRARSETREILVCTECGSEVEAECYYHPHAGVVARTVR